MHEDGESLQNFPQLTSLNAEMFAKEPSADRNAALFRMIAQLPRLKCLELSSDVLRHTNTCDLAQLTGISRLRHRATRRLMLVDVMKLAHLPLQELAIECSLVYLEHLIPTLPKLQHLEVRTQTFELESSVISVLKPVNRLKLIFERGLATVAQLTQLTSLVALEINRVRFPSVEAFRQLPRLGSLSITVMTHESLFLDDLSRFSKKLDDLSIFPVHMNAPFARSETDEPIHLQSLRLTNCLLGSVDMLHRLTSLTCLILTDCQLEHGLQSLTPLKRLRMLCLMGVFPDSRPLPPAPLKSSDFRELKVLSMELGRAYSTSMEMILSLTGLEILGLDCPDPLPHHKIAQLDLLPNLRELGVFCPQKEIGKDHRFFESQFLIKLEALWVTNFNEICSYREKRVKDQRTVLSSLYRLLQNAPHLKVTNGVSSIRSLPFLEYLCRQCGPDFRCS